MSGSGDIGAALDWITAGAAALTAACLVSRYWLERRTSRILEGIDRAYAVTAARAGFSDHYIAVELGRPAEQIREWCQAAAVDVFEAPAQHRSGHGAQAASADRPMRRPRQTGFVSLPAAPIRQSLVDERDGQAEAELRADLPDNWTLYPDGLVEGGVALVCDGGDPSTLRIDADGRLSRSGRPLRVTPPPGRG